MTDDENTSEWNKTMIQINIVWNIAYYIMVTCLLAGAPTNLCLSFVKATVDGVVLTPSLFSMTLGVCPSMTATQELVVPRSIPII
jgi:hypothetical protein